MHPLIHIYAPCKIWRSSYWRNICLKRKTPYSHIQWLHMPAGITEEEGSGGEWNTFLHIQHTHIVYSSSLDIYRQHKIALSYRVTKNLVSTHIKSTMISVDRCISFKYSKPCNPKCLTEGFHLNPPFRGQFFLLFQSKRLQNSKSFDDVDYT